MRNHRRVWPLDERGVALPLALLALVGVSLLVTAALLTSSTEYAISRAQQDATSALYVAEGGLQSFIAERATLLVQPSTSERYTPPGGGDEVTVGSLHLGDQLLPGDTTVRLYSLTATPTSGGGRTVSALITLLQPPGTPLDLKVTSALAVAGDLNINGNAFSVDGTSKACGSSGVSALRYASDSQLTFSGNAEQRLNNFSGTTQAGTDVSGTGALDHSDLSHVPLVDDMLMGRSIGQIANGVPKSSWRYRLRSPVYTGTWLADTALKATTQRPNGGVAVVDAEGGEIRVPPGVYTGLLIVINGSVIISGNQTFNGIILVERNFTVTGNVTINGALLSLAMDGSNVLDNTTDDSSAGSGSIEINYDKCKVDTALKNYGDAVGAPQILRGVSGWMEVSR